VRALTGDAEIVAVAGQAGQGSLDIVELTFESVEVGHRLHPTIVLECRRGIDDRCAEWRFGLMAGETTGLFQLRRLMRSVAVAVSGSSGQWCLGYRPFSSFLTSG
jgi:hypothetical protein